MAAKKDRKFEHFTPTDRIRLETMLRDKVSKSDIASRLGKHISSIYREVKCGIYEHTLTDLRTEIRYSCDKAEQRYRANLAAKGAPLKIGADRKLAEHIERKIRYDKYSPAAVLGEIKRKGLTFDTSICTTTLYSYIDKGIFLHLTNKHLTYKPLKTHHYNQRPPRGESIEKRPALINDRSTFGHWEMDSVKGKQGTKPTLLVLTERLTRQEIQIPMCDGTKHSVVTALDNLEYRYGELFSTIFKTVTVDNGSEFSDCEGMEKSVHGGKRTKFYYCHPYSSWERGSNEKQNQLIRRYIPKGTPIDRYTSEEIEGYNEWLNNYPRAIFGWESSADRFAAEIEKIRINSPK
jgi:IS30 family transposase